MAAYYNENDPYAAQWLRNLIAENIVAPGDVDERSIVDVRPADLRGYAQCHFFAGIGGWSIALRQAGWPDNREVWTGSCPCQPFSCAGKRDGTADPRHLWPYWGYLVSVARPPVVFGEQVAAAVKQGWLDAVFADLEGEGYACGAAVLPACGVGAPHIRQRLWFVANTGSAGAGRNAGNAQCAAPEGDSEGGFNRRNLSGCDVSCGPARLLADADGGNAATERQQRSGQQRQQPQDSGTGSMDNAERNGWRTERRANQSDDRLIDAADGAAGMAGFWSDAEWIACTDGKARPVGPGSFPLGHGIQRRASKLRAYGNAIVPQAAQAFIRAVMESRP